HELVARAVEGADLRGRDAATRLHLRREEDRVRVGVALPAAREGLVPEGLGAVHDRDDAAVLALVRVLARLALLRDLARGVALADGLVVERRQLAEALAAREERDQQVD